MREDRPFTATGVHATAIAGASATLYGEPAIKPIQRRGPYLGRYRTTPLRVVPAEAQRPHAVAPLATLSATSELVRALYDLRTSLRAGRTRAELEDEIDDLLFRLAKTEKPRA